MSHPVTENKDFQAEIAVWVRSGEGITPLSKHRRCPPEAQAASDNESCSDLGVGAASHEKESSPARSARDESSGPDLDEAEESVAKGTGSDHDDIDEATHDSGRSSSRGSLVSEAESGSGSLQTIASASESNQSDEWEGEVDPVDAANCWRHGRYNPTNDPAKLIVARSPPIVVVDEKQNLASVERALKFNVYDFVPLCLADETGSNLKAYNFSIGLGKLREVTLLALRNERIDLADRRRREERKELKRKQVAEGPTSVADQSPGQDPSPSGQIQSKRVRYESGKQTGGGPA